MELVRGPAAQKRLEAGGLMAPAARDRALLLARCASVLLAGGAEADAAARSFFVPGRVEILGKHTDYCGGRLLHHRPIGAGLRARPVYPAVTRKRSMP